MLLNWRASIAVTGMHTAAALMTGQTMVDAALAAEVQPAVVELASVLQEARIDPQVAIEHLCGLAAQLEANRQFADVVLTKLVGRGRPAEHVDRLTRAVGAIELAIARARPRLAEELPLRAGPLREQWEARGPGLVRLIAAATAPEVIAERVDVLLVEPVTGGGGAAHPMYNSLRIEAVLANADARLPEVARLAWLAAQLQLDLPMFSEGIAAGRRRMVGTLAMLPVVVDAAEQVDCMTAGKSTLALALTAWNGESPATVEATANVLQAWWTTYTENKLPWPLALAALDRMLGEATSATKV